MNKSRRSLSLQGAIIRFFGNPLVGFLGSVASIVGLILAVFFYLESREAPELTYHLHPIRTSVVKAGEASDLLISHKGKEIKGNVSAAQVAIWNAGKKPIKREEILLPIVISTEGGQPVLEAKIRRMSRPLIGFTLDNTRLHEGKVIVGWRILERGDGAIIQMIYAGDQEVPLRVSGSVVGQNKLVQLVYSGKLRSPEEQYNRNARIDRILGTVTLVMSLVMFASWIALRKKGETAERSSYRVLTLRVALVSGCLYVAVGVWMVVRSWQFGPSFGF